MSDPIVALDARLVQTQATGDSTYWTGLLYGLAAKRQGVRFLLYSNQPKPPEIPDSPEFTWIELNSRRSRWWSLFRFPLHARRAGANVLHTQYNLSPLAGKGGVTTIHDLSFFIGPDWFRNVDRVLLQRFVPASARRAGRVIAVSETTRKDIATYIPGVEFRVRVVGEAAHPTLKAVSTDQAKATVRESFGLEGDYLLTVGTRWPRKNFALAEAAISQIERTDVPLVVTGKAGWDTETENPRIRRVGYVSQDQLAALYGASSLYLIPSHYEGFGLTMLEAFRCGAPVLSSQGGALPEVAGDAAEMVPSWEPADWTSAINRLLADSGKLEGLRIRGREREKEFTWEAAAQATVNVYRELF